MNTLLPSFCDELMKISQEKSKLSGETTLDPDNATRTLAGAVNSQPKARGPHPALNLEFAKIAETDAAWWAHSLGYALAGLWPTLEPLS